jgi:hypothetical protein
MIQAGKPRLIFKTAWLPKNLTDFAGKWMETVIFASRK